MGLLLVACAALMAFAWRIIVKVKFKPSNSDLASTSLIDFFAAITALLFVPITGVKFPTGSELLVMFLLSIIFSAVSDYLILYATKNADTADTSVLMPLSSIWVVLLAVIFLGESLTVGKIAGVLLIVLGSVVTLSRGLKLVINRGILAAFLYGWLITGTILIDKGISDSFSMPVYGAIFYFLSSTLLALMSGRNFIHKIKVEWQINSWWNAVVGVIWGLFTLALLFAYAWEDASKAVPLMRVFIVLVTLYSVFVLREKERMWQKVIGSVIVTLGAFIMAYLG